MNLSGRKHLDQLPGVFEGVVDPVKKGVLERNPLGGTRPKRNARVQKILDRELPIDAHQLGAQVVVGRVQADRQEHVEVVLDHLVYPRDHARGRERDPPLRQAQAVVLCQDADRAADVVVVVERFPHPHEHHVGDLLVRVDVLVVPVAEVRLGVHHLGDDLAHAEVPQDALVHRSRVAEGALERAPDLRRHADGPAPPRLPALVVQKPARDVDALDGSAVLQPQQPLARPVLRERGFRLKGRARSEEAGQGGAGGLGDVRHRRHVVLALLEHPLPQLVGSEGPLPELHHLLPQVAQANPHYVDRLLVLAQGSASALGPREELVRIRRRGGFVFEGTGG
mmetsp:Transcript_32815/g.79867  ORF Transcript_32815/g.79867 Transcript_32815/m.79867 type:complete len:338 (+) Transcript_32815:392-1405(+)